MSSDPVTERPSTPIWQRAIPWLLALLCFGYLVVRLRGAAQREDLGVLEYLAGAFANVDWPLWIALMIPYSLFFFLVDSAVVWRVINWFNGPVPYRDILPIRASAYIISIFNEQIGKGAMAVYLNRRHGVPAWEVGSSMLFIMFCEFYYLLTWGTIGYFVAGADLPRVFVWVPRIAVAAALFFPVWVLYFRGRLGDPLGLRERPILKAFREARAWQYWGVVLLRSPAILGAVVVYTVALGMFGIQESFVNMLGYLPVVFFAAAVPTPMRMAAITLWVTLYPASEAQMTAFGVVQHNFFIFFNAAIGLLFLRRANRELFG